MEERKLGALSLLVLDGPGASMRASSRGPRGPQFAFSHNWIA